MTKENIVHIKITQSNKMNIIQRIAGAFYRKYSDGTSFVIINIFQNNCNLITLSVFVTVTDYSYICYVIKLCNFITCN